MGLLRWRASDGGRADERRICVIGGGVSGLSAAHALLSAKWDPSLKRVAVDVYEAEARLGGNVQSVTLRLNSSTLAEQSSAAGMTNNKEAMVELGPQTMAAKHAEVETLLEEVGLPSSKREYRASSSAGAPKVLVMRSPFGPQPVPTTPGVLLSSKLLTVKAKLRLLAEPFVRRKESDAPGESVHEFFSRRFGSEVADFVVSAAVNGIYAGNARVLSAQFAFPTVVEAEARAGSVLRGFVFGKKSGSKEEQSARKQLARSFKFKNGMVSLVDALTQSVLRSRAAEESDTDVQGRVFLSTPVNSVATTRDGHWRVNKNRTYDAIICAVPSYAMDGSSIRVEDRYGTAGGDVLRDSLVERVARKVQYASVAIAALVYKSEQWRNAQANPNGSFGVLVPPIERARDKNAMDLLGVTFSKVSTPNTASDSAKGDWVGVAAFLGGALARDPNEITRLGERGCIQKAEREIQRGLGVSGEAVAAAGRVWAHGIPQPGAQHGDVQRAAMHIERLTRGTFALCGNYLHGVGLPDAILQGILAARRVQLALTPNPASHP